ncbi:MAG: TetR/AcrR family transcriptional regulator [Verrucomicrobiota bacterium JB022]|nr:TetR/AcrR family transcriptional regulator [Verrucomicrobiota bacterium JB022]
MSSDSNFIDEAGARKRLSWDERHRQLLDVAWRLIRQQGTEALSLAQVAAEAGVTKPLAYNHFESRTGLLIELYREFDVRQTRLIETALEQGAPTPKGVAKVIAVGYVDCVMAQAQEIPGLVAALGTSPELEAVKRQSDHDFLHLCKRALDAVAKAGAVGMAGMYAMLGAAEGLSHAAANKELSPEEAKAELQQVIEDLLARD